MTLLTGDTPPQIFALQVMFDLDDHTIKNIFLMVFLRYNKLIDIKSSYMVFDQESYTIYSWINSLKLY